MQRVRQRCVGDVPELHHVFNFGLAQHTVVDRKPADGPAPVAVGRGVVADGNRAAGVVWSADRCGCFRQRNGRPVEIHDRIVGRIAVVRHGHMSPARPRDPTGRNPHAVRGAEVALDAQFAIARLYEDIPATAPLHQTRQRAPSPARPTSAIVDASHRRLRCRWMLSPRPGTGVPSAHHNHLITFGRCSTSIGIVSAEPRLPCGLHRIPRRLPLRGSFPTQQQAARLLVEVIDRRAVSLQIENQPLAWTVTRMFPPLGVTGIPPPNVSMYASPARARCRRQCRSR